MEAWREVILLQGDARTVCAAFHESRTLGDAYLQPFFRHLCRSEIQRLDPEVGV